MSIRNVYNKQLSDSRRDFILVESYDGDEVNLYMNYQGQQIDINYCAWLDEDRKGLIEYLEKLEQIKFACNAAADEAMALREKEEERKKSEELTLAILDEDDEIQE